MKYRYHIGALLLFFGFVVVVFTAVERILLFQHTDAPEILSIQTMNEPSPEKQATSGIRFTGEHEPYILTFNNPQFMHTLFPTWYRLSEQGGIEPIISSQKMDIMQKNTDRQLFPSVIDEDDEQRMVSFLTDPNKQKEAIEALVSLAKTQNHTGIDITFSRVPPEHGEDFTAFIKKLDDKLTEQKKQLSITLPPAIGKGNDSAYTQAFDWVTIGTLADSVQILGYNADGTSPNERYLSQDDYLDLLYYAKTRIPLEKIGIVLPLENTRWNNNDVTVISHTETLTQINQQPGDPIRDTSSGILLRDIQYPQGIELLAIVDSAYIKQRIQLAKNEGIHFFSYNGVGNENPFLWQDIVE
jgi:spore germination protein YaaH